MKTALPILLVLALFPAGDTLQPPKVGFDVLAGFTYKEGKKIPDEVTKYNKKKVRIGGFMKTEDGSEGEVEYFIIVNDACGCEGTPKLNEMVFCAMPEGETVKIKAGIADIIGTLYVEEEKEDGVVVSLYTMDVESVK
jgi:hypothetical protein